MTGPGPREAPRQWSLGPRVAQTAVAALVAVVALAVPAAADPAGPTNYESSITDVAPPVDGLEVAVLGGDAFLQLRNDGHEVVVPGYDEGEQYLRFDPDGSVFVNLRSAAYWQNTARYSVADSQVPADAGPDQPPRWVQVSDDGTWAWHDHRIHWMSPTTLPGEVDPALDEVQVAYDWPAPLELSVDGAPVEVAGRLTWLPDASPLPALLAAVLGLALVLGALAGRGPRTAIAVGIGLGVVVTGIVGVAATIGLPPGVQGEPLPLVLTAIAAIVAVAGLAMYGRTAAAGVLAGAAGVLAGAAGVPLLVWAATQFGAVTAPVVPPAVLPPVVARLAVGLAAGVGVGALVAGVRDLFRQPLAP